MSAWSATDLNDPEHGAGVSVGRWFRNVNWVAVPGYKLFYQGNLEMSERLTQARFDATVRDAIDKGRLRRRRVSRLPGRTNPEQALENFVANHGIGTDFALQFARAAFCARLPVTEANARRGDRLPQRQEPRVCQGRCRLQLECVGGQLRPYLAECPGGRERMVAVVGAGGQSSFSFSTSRCRPTSS